MQRHEDGDEPAARFEALERLADDRAERAGRVRGAHGVARDGEVVSMSPTSIGASVASTLHQTFPESASGQRPASGWRSSTMPGR